MILIMIMIVVFTQRSNMASVKHLLCSTSLCVLLLFYSSFTCFPWLRTKVKQESVLGRVAVFVESRFLLGFYVNLVTVGLQEQNINVTQSWLGILKFRQIVFELLMSMTPFLLLWREKNMNVLMGCWNNFLNWWLNSWPIISYQWNPILFLITSNNSLPNFKADSAKNDALLPTKVVVI